MPYLEFAQSYRMDRELIALIEKTATGFSAHVPDLPGCIAAAKGYDELRSLIAEAIEFHVEGMRLNGESVPEPSTMAELVEVTS